MNVDLLFSTLRRLRSTIVLVVVTSVVAAFTVVAARADGFRSTRAAFNTGSVWQADGSRNEVGQVKVDLDVPGAAITLGPKRGLIEVEQSRAGVVVLDRFSGLLHVVDDRRLARQTSLKLPTAAETVVRANENGFFVADTKAGDVRFVRFAQFASLEDLDSLTPLAQPKAARDAEIGTEPIAVEAGVDGAFYVYRLRSGRLSSFDPNGILTNSVVIPGADGGDADLGVVGATPIVLRRGTGQIVVIGSRQRTFRLTSPDWHLAMPSSQAESVVVANPDGDHALVDLRSGSVTMTKLRVGVQPIRPLVAENGLVVGASESTGRTVALAGSGLLREGPTLGSRLQGRLIWGRPYVDDLDSPAGSTFDAKGNAQLLKATSPEDAVTAGDNANGRRTGKDPSQAEGDESEQTSSARNRKPTLNNDPDLRARPERSTLLQVLSNDRDPDGDVLSVTDVLNAPAQASFAIAPNGAGVIVTPRPGFRGVLRFGYVAGDPSGLSGTAEATVTISDDGNAPPVPTNDSAKAQVGRPVLVGVLANDVDPDGDTITLTSVRSSDGEVAATTGGFVSFTARSPGTATLTYTASDEKGATADATITVEVTPLGVNQPPIARVDSFVVGLVPTELEVLANDIDPEGEGLTITKFKADIGVGRVEQVGQRLRVSPTRDGIAMLSYEVSDGELSAQASIRIDVRSAPSNRPPIALPDRVSVAVGQPQVIDVVANDIDPDGDVLAVQSWSADGASGVDVRAIDARRLEVSISSPPLNPVALAYTVSDGLNRVTSTVLVSAKPSGAGVAPIARRDIGAVRVGIGRIVPVLANDVDPDGGPVRIVALIRAPTGVGLAVDGRSVVIAPNTSLLTGASFEFGYTIEDQDGQRSSAEVVLSVIGAQGTNTPPSAMQDNAVANTGKPNPIAVLSNDSDYEGDLLEITSVGQPSQGTAKVVSGQIIYEPLRGSAGTDRFTYSVDDGHGGSASSMVQVGILPPASANRPPVARDDGPTAVSAGTSGVKVDVSANDTDPDGDRLTITGLDRPTVGEATLEAGKVRFVPPKTVTVKQTIEVRYRISDPSLASASAVARFTVDAAKGSGQPPIARPDLAGPFSPGERVRIDVLANDDDPDGLASELRVVLSASATVASDGRTIELIAPSQSVTFQYTVQDAQGLKSVGAVQVKVSADRAPQVVDDFASTRGEEIRIPVLANDSDPEGLALTVRSVSATPFGGTSTDGSMVLFRPASGASGEVRLTYTATDPANNMGTGVIVIRVDTGVPTVPATVREDAPRTTVRPTAGGQQTTTIQQEGGPRSSVLPKPQRPTPPVGQVDGNTIRFRWEPVASSTAYIIEVEGSVQQQTTDPSFTATGLSAGKAYRARVRAVQNGVQSDWSEWSGLVTIVDVPESPRNAAGAVSAKGKVTVTWELGSDNGAPIEAVIVACDGAAEVTVGGTQTRAEILLANGNNKNCRVTAKNAVGSSEPAVITIGRSAGRKPDAPSNVAAQRGDKSAVVVWQHGDDDVDGYEVVASTGQRQQAGPTELTLTMQGLANGTPVTFSIFTVTNGVRSDPATTAAVTPAGKPQAIASFAARHNGAGQIAITWSAADPNGSPVLTYQIACDVGSPVTAAPSETSKTITAPSRPSPAGKNCRISAHNELGAGPETTTQIVARDAPAAPGKPVGVRGDKEVALSWPTPGGVTPDDYIVSNGSTAKTVDGPPRTTCGKGSPTGPPTSSPLSRLLTTGTALRAPPVTL